MTTRSSSLSGYQGRRRCFGRPVSLTAGVGFWCLVCALRLCALQLCGLQLCDLRMISMHGVLVVG